MVRFAAQALNAFLAVVRFNSAALEDVTTANIIPAKNNFIIFILLFSFQGFQ
jgi:hypothetical protein